MELLAIFKDFLLNNKSQDFYSTFLKILRNFDPSFQKRILLYHSKSKTV